MPFVTPSPQPSATFAPSPTPTDDLPATPSVLQPEQEIAAALDGYFEARYRSFRDLALADFSPFLAETDLGREFWAREKDKLTLEIEHARQYDLRYAEYAFFLTYEEISLDRAAGSAEVLVAEGHDVVFSVSKPVLSSQRNLVHRIRLKKIGGGWKIESDLYEDYLWRWLNISGMSAAELREEFTALQHVPPPQMELPPSAQEKGEYDRKGVAAYAHRWAVSPHPYNAAYFDFSALGGDCTNFVSQALFEGGKMEMVFGGEHGVGTAGWYYYGVDDRSVSWTWVDGLYDFLLDGHAYEVDAHHAQVGDVLQFNWGRDSLWNHSVLIVSRLGEDVDSPFYLVAGHSPDVDNYPYTAMVYSDAFRIIHIAD